ncbi:hypothetical protein CRM22_005217 [Opisthorchis felineus]|uniref:Uncharacterized protein n=1 Tax=Opisthorchis felineus TaxID=147828 RepID=A0A4S2LZB5_OPIFE|nr:hypothetical protein CRM22_005217 [Opisthorchis felineus]
MFFHTLAQNTHFCDSVVTHALRFAHWDRPRGCECKYGSVVDWCGCSPVAFRGLRGEQQLCARVGGCLGYQPNDEPVFFARKFDPTVDLEVMEFVVKTMLGKVPYLSTRQFFLENIYSGELEADSKSSLRLIMPAIFETQLRQLENLVNLSSPTTTPSDFHKHLDAFALFNATYQRLSLSEEFPSLRLYPPELVLRAPVLITAGRVAPYSLILEILLQPPSLLWASELPVSQVQLGDVIYLEVATMFDGKEQLVRNYPRLLTTADTLQLIIMWKGEIAAPGRQARHLSTVAITISPTHSHPACVGHSTLSLGEGKHVLSVFDCPSCFLLVVPLTSVLHNCSITHGLWRVHTRASSGQVAQTEFFLFPLAPISTGLLSSSTWGSLQPSNFCVHSEGVPAEILPTFRKWDCSMHEWSTFSDDHDPDVN